MKKANGYHVIQLFFTLILLPMPASSQELRRDATQTPPSKTSRAADARAEDNAEQSRWTSIKNESDPREYKAYLVDYPRGRFASAARSQLTAMLGEDFVTLFMKRIEANKRWVNVEKQIVRRVDLLPVLVETLFAAGVQEQEFFGQLAEWRSRLLNAVNDAPQGDDNAKTSQQKRSVMEADNRLHKILQGLEAPVLENYPQLRSNEIFLRMRDELVGVENRVAVARNDYNNAVLDYNNARAEPRMAGLVERHGFIEEPLFNSDHGRPVEPKFNANGNGGLHL